MTLTTFAQLEARLPGIRHAFKKDSVGSTLQLPNFYDAWLEIGTPGAGVTPPASPGAVCTKDTTGALPLLITPGVGQKAYSVGVRYAGTIFTSGKMMGLLYDRLVHVGGFVMNSTAPQTVNSVALDRHTSGKHVQMGIEMVSVGNNANHVAEISYTNQDGVAGRTANLTFNPVGGTFRVFRPTLQSGDYGVRSVETFTLTTASTTAGNAAVVLYRELGWFHIPELTPTDSFDWLSQLSDVTDACLSFMSVGNLGNWFGGLDLTVA